MTRDQHVLFLRIHGNNIGRPDCHSICLSSTATQQQKDVFQRPTPVPAQPRVCPTIVSWGSTQPMSVTLTQMHMPQLHIPHRHPPTYTHTHLRTHLRIHTQAYTNALLHEPIWMIFSQEGTIAHHAHNVSLTRFLDVMCCDENAGATGSQRHLQCVNNETMHRRLCGLVHKTQR